MAVMKMCHILHERATKFWLRPDFLFYLSSYSKQQVKLLNIIHTLTKRVVKEKKETLEKNRNEMLSDIPIPPVGLKKEDNIVKDKSVLEGLSYGQSAGLEPRPPKVKKNYLK
uniref:Cytochrome P450 4g15 n=1 Tax=Cacopsylla melanoneura TaxID=428564 RepID=A0A8D8WNQ8_9HEMI